jgi:hypothetical protein
MLHSGHSPFVLFYYCTVLAYYHQTGSAQDQRRPAQLARTVVL